jgi:large subunit ribosomal protein L31
MPKTGIHPPYYPEAKITCSCGATYTIGSTRESLKVDICRECHPYYSGNQKLIDTAGRVDRFREKVAVAKSRQAAKAKQKKAATPEASEQTDKSEGTN